MGRSKMRSSIFFELTVVVVILTKVCSAQIYEDMYCGRNNCYDVLGLSRTATKADIARAYRQLARKWHPDMHKDQEEKEKAVLEFRKVANAYEILKDEDARRDYDYMLDHPDEFYYNYYAYYQRRITPKVDVRIVIVVTISVISILQYLSAWNNYRTAINYFLTVPKYRMQATEIARREGLLDNKKKKDRTKSKEELKEEEESILKMIISDKMDIRGGYQKPKVLDMLWFQLFLLPYRIVMYVVWYIKWIYKYNYVGEDYDDDAKWHLIRSHLKMSQGQWEMLEDHEKDEFMEHKLWVKDEFKKWKKQKDDDLKAELAQNNRYKIHRRYMKKGGPGQMTFLPD